MVVTQYLEVDVVEGVCDTWRLNAVLQLDSHILSPRMFPRSFGPGNAGLRKAFTISFTVSTFPEDSSPTAKVVFRFLI